MKDNDLIFEAYLKEPIDDKGEWTPEPLPPKNNTNDALTSLLSNPEEEVADLKNLLVAIDGLMSGAYNLGSNGGEGQSDQFMEALKSHLQTLYPGFDDQLIELVHGRVSEALADN